MNCPRFRARCAPVYYWNARPCGFRFHRLCQPSRLVWGGIWGR